MKLKQEKFNQEMTDPGNIAIDDYDYDLPDDRIALQPLPARDASKLLIYQDGEIKEDIYRNLSVHLPAGCTLVFNDTRVINARIRFKKNSGSIIEVFCLEPVERSGDYVTAMNRRESARWKCFVGGAAKWKEAILQKVTSGETKISLQACIIEKLDEAYIIEFSWQPANISFAEVLEIMGDVPLPPYIKRAAEPGDEDRYQTIYANSDGSVAAPTAGLHFTEKVFQTLAARNISPAYITLHVGAGTFKPVKTALLSGHQMHAEWIDVSLQTIRDLRTKTADIIAVGTTSTRTLETLYWLGVKSRLDPYVAELTLEQWEVYQPSLNSTEFSADEALQSLIWWMENHEKANLFTQTQLMIVPGYKFRMVKAIVTNFHQPKSTLLLLLAAATHGNWKNLYQYALQNDFRFLSYGDGSLVFI